MPLPDSLLRLIEELQRLPGIGPKGAQRLAFHILKTPREQADRLADALREVKERVTYCSVCNNITDADPCTYCSNADRNHHVICVVEEPQNVTSVEGAPPTKRVAIQVWDSMEKIQAWRNSADYKKAREIGDKYAKFRAFTVEGLPQ